MAGSSKPRERALVTGASSGIGAAFAEELAERGHDLVLVARRADRLEGLAGRLAETHAIEAEVLVADLSVPTETAAVAARFGAGDIGLLINNAGISGFGPFDQTGPALLARVVEVNVSAPTALARAAVPAMLGRGGGAIINVASVLAFSGGVPPAAPMPHRAVYAATKGYIVTLSRVLAAELADTTVRVQALCPGLTATEFHLSDGSTPVPGAREQVHDDGGMPAGDVVTASLLALERGETVCIPGLANPTALDDLASAEAVIRTAAGAGLAERYRRNRG
ncbi:SDR family NAD(P)-dependent oxidoreductase [Mycobacterium koreense]|uniref:Short-chain dehydrogenase n=1 Tax=Mycolicibacillus koreensis TaxID=1069220 RepID=A0A7I7SFT1_9MYCO|nr:SDR family NAD(P)-dependent oxidoreductase [Mycolicibacillus koreensis]MCV7248143.1 SDR family NAD(P)-dependent oxidoreductase [Mycolicibacillus koreensis]OSC35743.1 short-chain dehydrogenase [Mycolicibacillus koreensis]BBY55079.1 short-chain dehydrogenase [Mycolicibacillus koreensis]